MAEQDQYQVLVFEEDGIPSFLHAAETDHDAALICKAYACAHPELEIDYIPPFDHEHPDADV